ncbi:hypothetical protein AFLA_013381 [Aspergillus flavus NRRL3357]|nr:hypothetical protein AFLA_013381 [Aspergillus flavus NRRL3357]
MQRSTKDVILSRRQIEALIAEGQSIIIVNQKVLRVDAWIPYHPGGQKVIQHVVGKDATDEFTIFHCEETRQMSERYQIGRIEGRWANFVPPIQGGVFRSEDEEDDESTILVKEQQDSSSTGLEVAAVDSGIHKRGSQPEPREDMATQDEMAFLDTETKEEIKLTLSKYPALDDATQDEIIAKYRLLHKQIHAEGLYTCNYTAYAWEFARCSLLFSIMLFFLHIGWYNTSALFLAWFWSQMVFAAHDAGHIGITQNFTIDSLIGMTIAAPIGGLSLGWWKRSHNVHHIVTNAPEHDPDNQHLPFLAVNHRFLGNIFSTYHERLLAYDKFAKALVPYQAYLYYIILLFGRFNLYVQSWLFLAKGQGPRKGPAKWHRWYEICGNVIFWLWFGYGILYKSIPTPLSRISFVLISHMATCPSTSNSPSPTSQCQQPTSGLTNPSPRKCSAQPWTSTVALAGLGPRRTAVQAIHHLYPRVPRHNCAGRRRWLWSLSGCGDSIRTLWFCGWESEGLGWVGGGGQTGGYFGEVSQDGC